MTSARLLALVLCMGVATGCGVAASAECEEGAPVVALNRNDDENPQGGAEVIVADSDGDVELVTGDWVATKPSFSPDGRRLVVVRAEGDYESAGPDSTSLWIVEIDATDPRSLTEGQLDDYDDHPAWSPDGATIAFSRQTRDPPGWQVMTVPAEGGDVDPLIPNDGYDDIAPAWSSDGRMLAFIRTDRPDRSRSATVWVVDADGSNGRSVAAVRDAHSLQWHPDQNALLVSSFGREDGGVALVDVDKDTVTQIADHATFAAWSPDGNNIYYFTKEGAPQPSWWRLAQGRLVEGRLERETYVGQIEDYLYPDFGLAASACAQF